MKRVDGWQALFRIAASRWGVVTIRDSRACGIPDATINTRRRREGWHRFGAGVHLLPGFPITLHATRFAALACAGRGATLSHATALVMHGFDSPLPGQSLVHVVIPHDRVIRPAAGVQLHRS